jgi:imidazolonepropionase-like amidohydrolase
MMIHTDAACRGEVCWCGRPAAKKVGEEIMFDDPNPARHNLTAYICAAHYALLMGPLGAEQVDVTRPLTGGVTEEAIEAGVSFVCGADHTFGKTLDGKISMDVLRQDLAGLYLAMSEARGG